jgi:hypothetical protein
MLSFLPETSEEVVLREGSYFVCALHAAELQDAEGSHRSAEL